jgi:hypothetical protein
MSDQQRWMNRKYLFIFRAKLSYLKALYVSRGLRICDHSYVTDFHLVKDIQSGWMDPVPQKSLVYSYSYLLDWLAYILPYIWWLRLCEICSKLRVERYLDMLLLNMHVLYKMQFGHFDAIVFYSKQIFEVTQSWLSFTGKIVIEYDGVPPSLSRRDLSREILAKRKYFVSNMDHRPSLGSRQQNFRQILMGLNDRLGVTDISLDGRNIDVLHVGNLNVSCFVKRCQIIEHLLAHCPSTINMRVHGSVTGCDSFPAITAARIVPIFAGELDALHRCAKVAIVIPSDDHLLIASGMPTRLFENAAYGVAQVIFRTAALSNTEFQDERDYLGFETPEEMLHQIQRLIVDKDLWKFIAKNAFQLYRNHYTAQRQFAILLESIPPLNT